jgi:DHA1 family bicyclomycin/chloramphenicol resistance-like MFS transporter
MLDPPITAMRLAPFGEHAGAASVMLGFLQMLGASLGKTLFTEGSNFSPMTTLGSVIARSPVLAMSLFALLSVSTDSVDIQASLKT